MTYRIQINAQVQFIHDANTADVETAIQEAKDAFDFEMESTGGSVIAYQEIANLTPEETFNE